MILQIDQQYLPNLRTQPVLAIIPTQLEHAWKLLIDDSPPTVILFALWGMLTGWGCNEMYNYNWAQCGIEGNTELFWTMQATNVWLTEEQYNAFKNKEGGQYVSKDNGPNTSKLTTSGRKYLIWFEKPHAMSKKPAFNNSFEGCIDFIYMISKMYGSIPDLFAALKSGNPEKICRKIKEYKLSSDTFTSLHIRLCTAVRKGRIDIWNNKKSGIQYEYDFTCDEKLMAWYKRQTKKNGAKTNG